MDYCKLLILANIAAFQNVQSLYCSTLMCNCSGFCPTLLFVYIFIFPVLRYKVSLQHKFSPLSISSISGFISASGYRRSADNNISAIAGSTACFSIASHNVPLPFYPQIFSFLKAVNIRLSAGAGRGRISVFMKGFRTLLKLV